MALSYLSSRSPGYKSILRVTLTHSTVPFNLMKVHLVVAVEGRLFRKWFPVAPNLNYNFVWDKADVYSQKVYGLSEAFGEGKFIIYYLSFVLTVFVCWWVFGGRTYLYLYVVDWWKDIPLIL